MNLKGIFAFTVVGLVGIAAAPQPGTAQISQQGNKYLFRYKWEKGKVYNYNLAYTMTVPASAGRGATGSAGAPRPQTMNSRFSMKVIDVKGGTATIELTMPAAQGQPAPKPQRMTMDSLGRVQGAAGSNLSQQAPVLPQRAVGINETWTNTMQVPGMMGGTMNMTSTMRLTAVRTVGGRRVAEVNQNIQMRGSGMTGGGSGTYSHDMSDGMVRSARMNMTMTIPAPPARQGQPQAKPMSIPLTVTISRL
ncbi:MAG: hypothetical protein MUC92_05260 [Fimbriimonadaceae bacterium]|nr:hypothetical protein [Fimbriimonadaceae bacterium]